MSILCSREGYREIIARKEERRGRRPGRHVRTEVHMPNVKAGSAYAKRQRFQGILPECQGQNVAIRSTAAVHHTRCSKQDLLKWTSGLVARCSCELCLGFEVEVAGLLFLHLKGVGGVERLQRKRADDAPDDMCDM